MINFGSKVAIPILNAFISGGLTIPNSFFGFLVIDEAEFYSKEGFVQVVISPEFI